MGSLWPRRAAENFSGAPTFDGCAVSTETYQRRPMKLCKKRVGRPVDFIGGPPYSFLASYRVVGKANFGGLRQGD